MSRSLFYAQAALRGQVHAINRVRLGHFGHYVDMHFVTAHGKVLSKRDLQASSVLLKNEVLISQGGRTANLVDCYRDFGEIKIVFGAIGYLDPAFDTLSVHHGILDPLSK